MRRLRAFTFVEMLIAMVIMAILGGVVLTSLWLFYGISSQTGDQVAGRQEIEYVFQTIGREVTNISLGMPNNRSGEGTFAEAFRGVNDSHPIMALMGEPGESWGGPITLASFDTSTSASLLNFSATMITTPINSSSPDIYGGPQIYYAWAVPVYSLDQGTRIPIKVGRRSDGVDRAETGYFSNKDEPRTFEFALGNAVATLLNFRYDGREVGLQVSEGRNMRSWVTFPTIRIPMLLRGYRTASGTKTGFMTREVDNAITLQMAPGSTTELKALLGGFEDVHVVQACRLYVNTRHELIQEIFGSDYTNPATSTLKVLAQGIAGMYFRFDAQNRLLTMYIATRGEDLYTPAGAANVGKWPSFAPPISQGDLNSRILVQSMTWRIRN